MARKISLQNSGKYSSGSTNDFFTLENDGDIAQVRFLYEEPDGGDIDYYVVHEVEIDGKKRYVACLAIDEEGGVHTEDCPLCQAGYKRVEKLFLQVYVESEDKVKTWDRGKTFVPKILTYINRYGSLVAQPIEIERHGKKGDTNTSYDLFPLEKDNKTVADFPEKQELLGTFILDLSAEDCDAILEGTYKLPNSDNSSSSTRRRETSTRNETPRRGASENNAPARESARQTGTNTPARGTRSRTRTGRTGGSDSF